MSTNGYAPGDLSDVLSHQLFRALGEPTRVRLVDLLADFCRASSVSELAECLDVDVSVVSRHLALLRAAGVLRATKSGRHVMYEIQYESLAEVLRGIADAVERAGDQFEDSATTTPLSTNEADSA